MNSPESPLLYERVKDALRTEILSGGISPGDSLPSERILGERFGVSRITAKRAVADLIQEGLVERLPHRKGAFVRRKDVRAEQPRLIAVAIDDVRDAFGSRMLRGIEDYLWDRRIHTLICNADRDFAKVEEYFESLLSSDVAGVIFAPVIDEGYGERNRKLVSLLEKASICYTLVDRYIPGLLANYAVANHEESSRILVKLLLERGFRRIVLVRGLECTSMDERAAGFRNAFAESGIALDERLVARINDNKLDERGGEAARLEEFFRAERDFDCVYALNDRLYQAAAAALAATSECRKGEVPLVTHSEVEKSAIPGVAGLPHFVEPSYEMGWAAAKILVEYIGDPGKAIVQKVLKSRIVPGA